MLLEMQSIRIVPAAARATTPVTGNDDAWPFWKLAPLAAVDRDVAAGVAICVARHRVDRGAGLIALGDPALDLVLAGRD